MNYSLKACLERPLKLMPFLLIAFIIVSCGIFGSDSKDKDDEVPVFTLYNNINDPLLLSAKTADGDSLAYFGTRNADGSPESITGGYVYIKNQTLNTGSENILLRDVSAKIKTEGMNGLPSEIEVDNYSFLFEWESTTDVIITTVDRETGGRSQIAFDLLNPDPEVEALYTPRDLTIPRKSLQSPVDLPSGIYSLTCNDLPAAAPTFNSGSGTVTIELTRCNVPVDNATVELIVDQTIIEQYMFWATYRGGGTYTVDLPIGGNNMGQQVGSACMSLVGAVGSGCDVANELKAGAPGVCAAIAKYALAGAPKVFATCMAGIAAYAFYCSTGNWSPDFLIPGYDFKPPAAYVCDAIEYVVDRGIDYFGEQITYGVIANHPNFKTPFVNYNMATSSPSGPYPNLSINLEGDNEVVGLWAHPGNPPEGVGYMVYASLACLDIGSEIELSIVGTDGYSDSTTCTAQLENDTCMLSVPGAEGGVIDTISLRVNGIILDTIIVVFGGGGS